MRGVAVARIAAIPDLAISPWSCRWWRWVRGSSPSAHLDGFVWAWSSSVEAGLSGWLP